MTDFAPTDSAPTAGPAYSSLELLQRDARTGPWMVADGLVLQRWGDQPAFERWRGSAKMGFTFVGAFRSKEEASL